MRKIILFIAALILLCSYSRVSYGQSETAVIKTAQNDLQMMLNQIPAGQLEAFGFTSRAEFGLATIGKPYRMVGLSLDFYQGKMDWKVPNVTNGKYVTPFNNSVIVSQNQWRVPVLVNGQQRMLLTVALNNGAYETVDMGAAGLAAELQEKSKTADPNSQFCLFRIYPLEADFFVESSSSSFENAKFPPLYAATMSMPVLNEMKAPLTVYDIMPIIKNVLTNR